MKFLYKQAPGSNLEQIGIQNCYYKKMTFSKDTHQVSKKTHHHTSFELHLVQTGEQVYLVDGKDRRLQAGQYLLIAPGTSHRAVTVADNTEKFSLTFRAEAVTRPYLTGEISPRLSDRLALITEEAVKCTEFSLPLTENAIAEIILTVLRQGGLEEAPVAAPPPTGGTLTLAKQYLQDNVERAPSVSEVAAYCGMSQKQLTRIFQSAEGCSPGAYLLSLRLQRAEQLLAQPTLSLGQISEQMNFSSEYYFNAFFKKHAGLPPGEYRKMNLE